MTLLSADITLDDSVSRKLFNGRSQVHVQCIHQHTPLREIFNVIAQGNKALVDKYLSYKSHVCREVYQDAAQ